MKARGAIGAALVVGLAVVGCGAEDVDLAPGSAGATRPDAGDAGTGGQAEGGIVLSGEGGAPPCDAASPAPACRALGDPCGSASDCCSTHCASRTCALPGTCAGAGTPCAARADCCSGLCEPVDGTATRACLAPCRPAGAACAQASDCCAFGCNAGTCGGAECLREGTDCTANAQCCSGECDPAQGKCALDATATCRPTAEDCTSGGGAPCCGVCDDASQRCDPGPGPCRPAGTVCVQAADCCHGMCAADSTGRLVCTSAPLADGATCVAGFECTSGSCVADPPVCGTAAPPCGITDASCATATDCCSGSCTSGRCDSGCTPAAP